MEFKLELDQWLTACAAFDSKDYETAVQTFLTMADNAKMHFNIGLIFAVEDDHERALLAYSRAITMDAYFAVAFFQRGVSQFVTNNMEAATQDFDAAYQKLRGNEMINYTQLGLAFRLYACEVLFNRGICQLYLGKIDAGLTDLYHAQKAKMTEEHDVIDQAVRDRGRGYSVFSIPPGILYRPSEARMRQLQNANMFAAVDRLGVAAKPNKPTTTTAATGIQRKNSVLLPESRIQRRGAGNPSKNNQPPQAIPPVPSSSLAEHGIKAMARESHRSKPTTTHIHTDSLPPTPVSSVSAHYSKQSPSRQYSPTERRRKNSVVGSVSTEEWADSPHPSMSSTSSFSSNLRHRSDGRRVDSGFESAHEERFSASSGRSSTRSQKTSQYTPPPVPPLPRSHSSYESPNTSTSYGSFDLDEVYGPLPGVEARDRERERDLQRLLASTSDAAYEMERRKSGQSTHAGHSSGRHHAPQPTSSVSTPTLREGGGPTKLRVKVHYTDTRILLVSPTITFNELLARVKEKFSAPATARLQYKDEEDEMVIMIDDDDLHMIRQASKLKHGEFGVEKIEIWCVA
ncbi:hypothetical protein BDF14DRAFT_1839500 [Spinellus fusiger]|nr:hypothetical protein BDF14DRAFT_1839500 [Spinellus fusiger]